MFDIFFNSLAVLGIGLEIMGFLILLLFDKSSISRSQYQIWMKKFLKKNPDWNAQTNKAALIDIEDYVNNILTKTSSEVPLELASKHRKIRASESNWDGSCWIIYADDSDCRKCIKLNLSQCVCGVGVFNCNCDNKEIF